MRLIDAKFLERARMRATGSIGLPEECWLSRDTYKGVAFPKTALDCCGVWLLIAPNR